jgi:phosphatidylglycerophosphatase A
MDIRGAFITCGGLGYLRPAPGTWGSLPPAVIAWAMLLDGASWGAYAAVLGVIFLLFGAACIVFGVWTQQHFGKKDPSFCVADETCAQCMPLLALPSAWFEACRMASMDDLWGPAFWRATLTVGGCFLLFRVLDIIKPWPGRWLEGLPYGFGVLADDLSSGLYAAGVVFGVTWLLL